MAKFELYNIPMRITFFIISCFLIFSSCKKEKKEIASSPKSSEGVAQNISYAKGFTITNFKDYKEIKVTTAWPESKKTFRYLLVEKGKAIPKHNENTVIIEVEGGNVVIELLPDVAPGHVERMKELARGGEYDNVTFHRVIDGFMAQTGDVANGDMEDNFNLRMAGTGGSDKPNLKAEFSSLPFDRGVLGAARSQNPDSANSQFFIMLADGHFLNNQYTVYGRVIEGMEHVDAIPKGEPPAAPGRMKSVKVAADV